MLKKNPEHPQKDPFGLKLQYSQTVPLYYQCGHSNYLKMSQQALRLGGFVHPTCK